MKQKVCIAMVPCPGLSHLIPLIEFAKLLVLHHKNFHVKFLIPTLGPPTPLTKSILNSLPSNIDFTFLPQINIQDLPPNIHISAQMKITVKKSLPSLYQAINTILTSGKNNLVGLVFDVFSSDVIDIAKKFNLLSYFFATSSAIALQFCLSLPKLDETISSEFIMDTTKTFDIPNSKVSFKVKDFPDPVLFGRSSESYKAFILLCHRLSLADGLIINSFKDLELDLIKSMENFHNVYPVGPIIQKESKCKQNESKCVTWLNKKPKKSVLYISFGSGGTLTNEQINEIAFGLELSGCNFLWVLRVPSKHSNSAYFSESSPKGNHNSDSGDDPLKYLPLGFLERTKDQGLVVPSWAPQIEILSHGSTGGFLTHCGWGSSLEGLVYGVPMICWPLFAEQRLNAATLTDVFKVGVRPKIDEEGGIIKGEEVARVIKIIMDSWDGEGLQLRRRIEDVRDGAAAAVGEDGSSRRALSDLVLKLEDRVITQKLKCFPHIN